MYAIALSCALLVWPRHAASQTMGSPGAATWWNARTAPAHYSGPSIALMKSLHWSGIGYGIEWAELDIHVGGGPLNVHVVLARFRTDQLRADLVRMTDASQLRGAWIVDSAAADVRIAVNAGQFEETGPWGWIVRDGLQVQPPGAGPLAAAVTFSDSGRVSFLTGADIARAPTHVHTAFQSYPRLLIGGDVVSAIRTGTGVDAGHRDARLAIGKTRDDRVILALTRFGSRETAASRIPIGLTLPETAALMGALGCADAVMLDGGLSAQMMLRPVTGPPLFWRGVRRVPVALVFRER